MKVKPTSLLRRAIGVVLLAELLSALALSVTALSHERRTRLRAFDTMLQGRSDSVLGAIQDVGDTDDHVSIDPSELRVPDDDVFAVYNLQATPGGSPAGSLVGESAFAPPELTARQEKGFSNRRYNGRRYRVFEREGLRILDRDEPSAQPLQRPVVIVYAASTDRIWHEILEAARFYAVVSSLLLGATALLLVLLLRRVLAPLAELAASVQDVSVHSPNFDPPASALRVRELQPLAATLASAIGRLRQALEEQHRFVGDAAHELKTAVAVVRSTIQVLTLRPRSSEEYAKGLEVLLEDNRRVEELVSQMLLLARMEEESSSAPREADLSAAAEAVCSRLKTFAEARGVALLHNPGGPIIATISSANAEVLISNLAVNAIEHSPAGSEAHLTVAARDGAVLLEVRDQGTGIAPSALPHVFERFYREDVSRSRATGGSGLGLSICKSIAEAAGGTIEVESQLGQGATVRVKLRPG
jgi:signal transduction histidine kinase